MTNQETLSELLASLQEQPTLERVKSRLEAGEGPKAILDSLNAGMNTVGDNYAAGEYFLAELVMAAEIFKGAMEILEPALASDPSGRVVTGKLVIGTVKGDLHDIGKNIFVGLARNAGFQVTDLGIDVKPEAFVEQVRSDNADIVGLSGILTLSLEPMKETVEQLNLAGLRDQVKVIIGGLAIDELWGERVGADAYTDDAYEGLRMIQTFMEKQR
jgi:methylmalonyl-CoA mutase cobalamin-binding domain/chain